MRTIASIAVLAASLVSANHLSAQKNPPARKPTRTVERGWPLDMDGAIRIHNYNGSVTITGWERDSVAFSAVVAGEAGVFGGGTRRGVKAGLESGEANNSPIADFTVFVPSRARLSIRGAATTIDIRHFAGTVDASTLSGGIKIAGSVTEVTAETMDGDLEIEASPGYFRGKTATGRITWTGSSDDVSLSTVSGMIAASGGTLFRARFESISGDVKFSGSVKPEAHVSLDTHGGDVVLALSRETRADLVVDSPMSTIMGEKFGRPPGKSGPLQMSIPRGVPRGAVVPSDITARSFKGRVTVTQP